MKNKIIVSFFLLLISISAFSQLYVFSKAEMKKYIEADVYYESGFYHLALPIYDNLLKLDSLNKDLNYKFGVCLFQKNDRSIKTLSYFENATEEYPNSRYYMAKIYHYNEQFDKAITEFDTYKNNVQIDVMDQDIEYFKQKSIYAKKMYAEPENLNIKNLGKIINTQYNEYVPLITTDDSTLLFTSRREGSIGGLDPNGEYYEDIYVSKKIGAEWAIPENIGEPINSATHDATVSISSDGKKLYIYRTNKDLSGGDIYESIFTANKWTKPIKMKGDINCKYCWNASGALSPDENVFYFSSNKPGGFGGKDIYKIVKLPDGKWSKATNLGETINTKYDEDAPFMHPDGETFYFSSKGHENMGEYDIFVSKLNIDGNWAKPKNVGHPINTAKDDIFFVVSANGKKAYYSSEKESGFGKNDIYEVEMLENPSNYVMLRGAITSKNPDVEKVEAEITITDLSTNKIHGIYRTTTDSQKYVFVLLPYRKYKLKVESQGYQTYEYEIDLTEKLKVQDLFKSIVLEKTN
ncbi:MAG: hypothetical protein A2W98_05720 [Bacteroidetes bacterium GWF2_33_38]|nr:MAG: hypothetical protein A2W98_05720 [Bacteroidetes bacterium GWF2_33_38]